MSIESLMNLHAVLTEVRAALHDTAEPCVIESLDEAIALVEDSIEKGGATPEATRAIYISLGDWAQYLPSIIALMRYWSG